MGYPTLFQAKWNISRLVLCNLIALGLLGAWIGQPAMPCLPSLMSGCFMHSISLLNRTQCGDPSGRLEVCGLSMQWWV